MTQKSFKKGDFVVYPSHGVGKITDIMSQSLGGTNLEFYQISFEKDKMNLSVPVARSSKVGLRRLCSPELINQSLDIVSETAQASRGIMWSRRAQEYEKKINSGDILAIAEVIRDLHRNVKNPDRSYSERLIYESAYNRFVTEVCHVRKTTLEKFESEFTSILYVDEIDNEDEDFDDDDDDDDVIAA
ncbi:MAG: CarD family transcriptional regulator [Alphaproteobacteria bacterium]|jgi:CarD family transcriptional regulator|nr:CarD family transcriptional regulator [Alphaproteobacteria bacterium]